MSMIVAGHFANKAQAENAVNTLLSGGVKADHILKANYLKGSLPSQSALEGERSAAGPEDTTISQPAGVLVAVNTDDMERDFAANVLRQYGASEVEETERLWRDGKWVDLDIASEQVRVEKSFW